MKGIDRRTAGFGVLVALAALLASPGCRGYRHGFAMPPGAEGVKKVAIDIFKNKTLYMDLENEFALELQREVAARTGLEVVSRGDADAVITGTIDSYEKVVLREFRTDEVSRYGIVVTAGYKFVRLPGDGRPEKEISAGEGVRWSSEFEVDSNITERDARAEAARRLAREVVNRIFEPW